MNNLGRWALIGFNGKISVLLSNEVCISSYMDACKIAEEKASKLGLECGMAIELKASWDIIRESAKVCNQEVK